MSDDQQARSGERHVDPRGPNPRRTERYPDEFVEKVLDEVENSADRVVDVAKRHHIATALLQKWITRRRPQLAGPARIRGKLNHVRPQFTGEDLTDDKLTAALFVIAHPVRRKIIKLAQKGPIRQVDLASAVEMSGAMWSHHFTKLVEVELLTFSGNGRNRFWTLNRDTLAAIIKGVSELAPGLGEAAAEKEGP